MQNFPIFLSIVVTVRDEAPALAAMISKIQATVEGTVSDYELIIVDNASADDSVARLKRLTGEDGVANLQVYALTREVDADTASWVGLENALGDFVAVIDARTDDIEFLPEMLTHAVNGSDAVFAQNENVGTQSLLYRGAFSLFNRLYKWSSGVNLADEAPQYRVLTRRVVSFILQHPQPAVTYRHLPARAGFARSNLRYRGLPRAEANRKSLRQSFDRGMRLLVSTTRAPMRLVTSLSLFGAASNIVYSVYVVIIGLFKSDVAPGWVSLSMQQSGMFFLISLVLLVLGEYILNMTSLSNEGPLYHVGQEFNSVRMTRRERLNIEAVAPAPSPPGTPASRGA